MGARQVSEGRVKGGNVVCYLVFTYNITSDKVLRVLMLFVILYLSKL